MPLWMRIILPVVAITLLSPVLISYFDFQFGSVNFFQRHGFLFLFFIAIFPRLTLLFSSVPFGGLFWWIGFFFAPRLLVAILATIGYWQTNPILVIISWVVALGGETTEKVVVHQRQQNYRRSRNDTVTLNGRPQTIETDHYEIKD